MNFLLNKLKNQRRKTNKLNIVIKHCLKQLIQDIHMLAIQVFFQLFDSLSQHSIPIYHFTID